MFEAIWKKCVNYETISYLICGILTTAVDFVSYAMFRRMDMGVGIAQAFSWGAAVLFAYVVNKLIVFKNYDLRPSYLMKEAGAFLMTRGISGVVVWLLMVVMVALGEGRGFLYEMFCKMVSSAVNLVANYIFSKLWIFKKGQRARGNSSETRRDRSGRTGTGCGIGADPGVGGDFRKG